MIDSYNRYNLNIRIEKLAKTILKTFLHIMKGEHINCESKWFGDDKYQLSFYKDNYTFSKIFYIIFEIKNCAPELDDCDSYAIYDPYVTIEVKNSNSITDMIRCEKFLLFIKNILSPHDLTGQYYTFYSSLYIDDIPYLIKKLSIKEYDFSNDIKKFNI